MLIVGVLGFVAAELLYGSRGPDTGVVQFILYGLVGFVPGDAVVVAGAKYAEEPRPRFRRRPRIDDAGIRVATDTSYVDADERSPVSGEAVHATSKQSGMDRSNRSFA